MDALAIAAVEAVDDGMVVGLGTGRAAARAIRALAERARVESLRLRCVATSAASEHLARSLGLAVIDPSEITGVDYLFDGADEVAPDLSMIKGGGGAMTRERIVAHMARSRTYICDASKLTPRLGVRARLPIEVLPMALGFVREELSNVAGLTGDLRVADGRRYATDNGNPVLDVALGPDGREPRWLADLGAMLDGLPGVVDHGLFLEEADELIVETADGATIERRRRPEEHA